MNDYDAWIKEVLDEATSPGGDLNAMVRRIYDEAYNHAKETAPKGLHLATPWQALAFLNKLEPEIRSDSCALASAFSEWFNDPNRDAPVKPTMHPDLEYLAGLDPETVRQGSVGLGGSPLFYKPISDTSCLCVVRESKRVPPGKQAFTLTEIEQARNHLAKQKANETAEALNSEAADRRYQAVWPLDLNNLPDYRLWFDIHGSERTVKYEAGGEQEASIHGIYNNFRARLLDELRQAGVIGEES